MVTFDAVYAAHAHHMRATVSRFLGHQFRGDVDDVCQDAWLKVAIGLAHFRGDASPGSWIYRIAFNTCMSHLRDRRTRQRLRLTELDPCMQWFDETPSIEFVLMRQQIAERVETAMMDRMSHEYCTVLRLRYVYGMQIAAIASHLQLPAGTVKSRLYRGRAILLRHVGAYA